MSDSAEKVSHVDNHSKLPLLTVQLMTHSGDLQFLSRAIDSLKAQTLDSDLFCVQIVFDGEVSDDDAEIIDAATSTCKFQIYVVNFDEKSGYYTIPRNRALPLVVTPYIVHMDADNEFKPNHLEVLLTTMRGENRYHFAYTRREYVRDEGSPDHLPTGPSPYMEWNKENRKNLKDINFIDTGDFIIATSALYALAEKTGYVWNSNLRRFGDWNLIQRMNDVKFVGHAIDEVSHVYHWHSNNLQHTRSPSEREDDESVVIPESLYEELRRRGQVRE